MFVSISLLFVVILIWIVVLALNVKIYKNSTYAKSTGNKYLSTVFDTGKYGEYLVYRELASYEKNGGKFLFNCYLPKTNGATTEIDVILIISSGIFVIESKNYSGWIFGSETSKTWTQTLRGENGKVIKNSFYNPIMQNNTHIKWLKKMVDNSIPIYSVIAFSERCKLKDVRVEKSDVKVINRQYIYKTIKEMDNSSMQNLSSDDIESIYKKLFSYTQVTEYEKLQHIENVKTIKERR